METVYVPREQFTALSEALDAATATGTFPKCPECGRGNAIRQTIRSSPGLWAISFSCEHVVQADPNG